MKKFAALLLAILMAFTACTAFASAPKSPSIESLYRWNPAWEWEFMPYERAMTQWLEPMITRYLSEDYEIWDALQLHVEYPYATVRLEAPTIIIDGDYMIILTNEDNTYYMTPIIIQSNVNPENAVAIMDFTGVEPAWYNVFILHDDV